MSLHIRRVDVVGARCGELNFERPLGNCAGFGPAIEVAQRTVEDVEGETDLEVVRRKQSLLDRERLAQYGLRLRGFARADQHDPDVVEVAYGLEVLAAVRTLVDGASARR